MISTSANMICECEWSLFTESQWVLSCIRHQERWCCQAVTGAGCEAAAAAFFGSSQRRLWFHFLRQVLRGFLFLLDQWEMFLVLVRRLVRLECRFFFKEFHLWRIGEGGAIKKEWQEKKEEGESVLVKVPFHSTRLSVLPRQQLVNFTQLTRLWYKLINDMHLARRGKKEKGEHMITSIKREAEDCLMSWNIQQLLCCTEIEES